MKHWNKLLLALAGTAGVSALSLLAHRRMSTRPRSMGEKSYSVELRPLSIPAGEHSLYGELLLPKGQEGPLPTVICCHGYNGSYLHLRDSVGKCLAMSGFAVCCFDFYGGSLHSRSGGSMKEMSIFTEREDLLAVIDYVKGLESTDTGNLFLLGSSQGGAVAAITAAQRAEDIRAMVLYYPAFCIPEDARSRFSSVEELPEEYTVLGGTIGRVYAEKLLDYDIYQEIKAYRKPVLILHGDADTVVDIRYGKEAAKVYYDARLIPLPGEVHGFSWPGKLAAARYSYQFLRAQVKTGDA